MFITHADVAIDAAVPVPDWGLNERGKARHRAHAAELRGTAFSAIWCSRERKARDGAAILSDALGVPVTEDARLGENDRSATGYMPKVEFERAADAFFAEPDLSFHGWETARDAQTRIVTAVSDICDNATGNLAIVSHGGVGALLLCHLMAVPISREMDQPGGGGGNAFRFTWPDKYLLHGWRDIAPL
nr:histidine phosphatase family protein [Pseudoruegeria sp. HB172150]